MKATSHKRSRGSRCQEAVGDDIWLQHIVQQVLEQSAACGPSPFLAFVGCCCFFVRVSGLGVGVGRMPCQLA